MAIGPYNAIEGFSELVVDVTSCQDNGPYACLRRTTFEYRLRS